MVYIFAVAMIFVVVGIVALLIACWKTKDIELP
jgi:hypothetical protein